MSIDEDVQKAKQTEQRLLADLNAEQGWIARHPGWVTLIISGLLIVAIAKGCH